MVEINKDECIGCGKCVKDCVAKNIFLREEKAQIAGKCFLCGHCVAICPVNAVSITEYDMADVEEVSPDEVSLNANTLLKAIKFRRSIRNYQQKPLKQTDMEMILQAGRYTATAKNSQGCRFIVVQKELEIFKSIIWDGIGNILKSSDSSSAELYRGFYEAQLNNPKHDYLFRNAPAVLFIAADSNINAGLAIQNMEIMGISLGVGFLYNGYLSRAATMIPEAKKWLGAEEKKIEACALLGYPAVTYSRTAPRKLADIILR